MQGTPIRCPQNGQPGLFGASSFHPFVIHHSSFVITSWHPLCGQLSQLDRPIPRAGKAFMSIMGKGNPGQQVSGESGETYLTLEPIRADGPDAIDPAGIPEITGT